LEIHQLSLSTNQVALNIQEDVGSMKNTASSVQIDTQVTKDTSFIIRQDGQIAKDASLKMHQVIQSASDIARQKKRNEQQEKIHRTPDPSIIHNRASQSRQTNTGSWLLQGKEFKHWNDQRSILWFYGKPGCGKTVLSPAIINGILLTV
jgi:DNA replication protein DnaC